MRDTLRRATIAVGLMVGALAFAADAAAQTQDKSILQKVLRTKELTVGVISGNPPWEFTTPAGELDGYEIAIAKQLAKDMGVTLKMVESNAAGRVPALQTGKVDVLIAALNYSPERAMAVAFTRPYAHPQQQFLVAAGSPFQTADQLNDPSATLGHALGGIEARTWPVLMPKAKLSAFNTQSDAQQALLSGRVTATGDSSIINGQIMAAHPGKFRVLNPPYVKLSTGMALAYGDFDRCDFLARSVRNLIVSRHNQKF